MGKLEASTSGQAAASTPSKKALRQRRQRENAQKRKASLLSEAAMAHADGHESQAKRLKLEILGAEAFRNSHQISVHGCEDIEPCETFQGASQLGRNFIKQLRKQGYLAPTPIQAEAWPRILGGHDLVAVAATGSGKTLGFLLPALARLTERGRSPAAEQTSELQHPRALVLAPTRELAQQISGEAQKFLIGPLETRPRCVTLFGGVEKFEQIKKLKKGADLVIGTPGRVLDLATGNRQQGKKPTLTLKACSYLVLDEADRMLDMGFEPDIRLIVSQCLPSGGADQGFASSGIEAGTKRQTLFFTATWLKNVQSIADSFTAQDALHIRIGQAVESAMGVDQLTAVSSVKQTVHVIEQNQKIEELRKVLTAEMGKEETAIVFAGTKLMCETLVRKICKWGSFGWCDTLHGDIDQKQRNKTLRTFRGLTSGHDECKRQGVLVATDVAARGLDIPGVALIVIYDYGSAENHVHRVGRTGRAGATGRAVTLFSPEDEGASELVQLLRRANQEVPAELEALSGHNQFSRRSKVHRAKKAVK